MTDLASVQSCLAAFLRAGATKPFAWGTHDDCTWACAWVAERRGVDPAAPWRGRYRTARGAMLQIKRAGGDFAVVVADAMKASGLAETREPRPGDVGLVQTPAGVTLAIRTKLGWAAKAERGIAAAPFPCLRAWSV